MSPRDALTDHWADVGARLRDLRQRHGWSMRELARRAGVSQPFVSRVESGSLRPSLPSLYMLAATLEVPPSRLLPPITTHDDEHEPSPVVHLPLTDDPASPDVRLREGGEGMATQVFEFVLASLDGDDDYFHHRGEEVVFVIDGDVNCQRVDQADVRLMAGQSLRIDPSHPHRWRAGANGARFLLICNDPV